LQLRDDGAVQYRAASSDIVVVEQRMMMCYECRNGFALMANSIAARDAIPSRMNAMKAPANLTEKLATFTEPFSPRTVATYNDNDIMVAKLVGPYHWHKHDDTDDFFFVLKGTLDIELRDRTITLNAGEVFVVLKGVEHRPVARGEVHILLIEPTGTPNSGDKATAAPRILA
jgi:mannose-6-phosphate isomerase-like protein (cupin superfamily)